MSWHLWPVERAWPASAEEEATFVTELMEASSREPGEASYRRAEVTAIVTALRNGAGAHDVLAWACGLRPSDLLAAYNDLDRRRREALEAWHELAEDPTTSSLAAYGPAAARLVPAVVGQMTKVMRDTSGAGLPLAAAKLQHRIDEVGRAVAAIERRLAVERDPERARRLGCELFVPFGECLWGDPMFAPSRVGQLSPQRVADLLAEEADLEPDTAAAYDPA